MKAKHIFLIALLQLIIVASVAATTPNSVDCSTTAIDRARDVALKLSKKGQQKAAAKTLAGLYNKCSWRDDNDSEEDSTKRASLMTWLWSDYALYLFKAADYNSCIEAVSHFVPPFNVTEDEKANNALSNNFDKCVVARTKQLGEPLASEKCPLKSLKKDTMAVSLPAELRAPNEVKACLTFEALKKPQSKKKKTIVKDEDVDPCALPVRYSVDNDRHVQRTVLQSPDKNSIINDTESCCWVESISFVRKDSAVLILLGTTQARQICDERGTRRIGELSTFSLKEKQLIQIDTIRIGYH